MPVQSSSSFSSPMHQRKNNGTTNGMYNNNRYGDVEGGGRRQRGGGGGASSDANTNILEQQNNERIDLLSDQVARLKGLTIDIGNEVRDQNSLLDNMGDGFQNTKDLLAGSLQRIGTMLQTGGGKHMCYMVSFCVFVMIFLYWLMKTQRK